jgi:plasmid stabilization system protein ParE
MAGLDPATHLATHMEKAIGHFYTVGKRVDVLRILHGARDFRAIVFLVNR